MNQLYEVNVMAHAMQTFYVSAETAEDAGKIAAVLVLCQDNGHIKPLFFSKISKMHKLVAFIPRFA